MGSNSAELEELEQKATAEASQPEHPRRSLLARMDEESVVRKPNEAVAIRPTKGRLTLLTRRIYNALLFNSVKQGGGQGPFELPLATLIGDAQFNSRNVALFKDHIREMQTTLVEWNSVEKAGQRWTSAQLLGTVTIEERGRGNPVMLTWTLPKDLGENLLRDKRYTRVLLEVGGQMRSYAAAVLFEIAMQYLTFEDGKRKTMREDLLWWASVLTGRSDIKSVEYRFFNRDTIQPALTEVNALQDDFTMVLIEHKRGRKVEEIQFQVLPKAQMGLPVTVDRNAFDLELVDRMRKLGLSEDEVDSIYVKTDEGLLRATLNSVEARLRNASLPPIASPVAYLRNALKNGYAAGAVEVAPKLAAPERPKAGRSGARASMATLRDEWRREQAVKARRFFESASPQRAKELQVEFEQDALPGQLGAVLKAWAKDGPQSKVAGAVFFRWLAAKQSPAEPSDAELLEFALAKGLVTVDASV